MLVWGDKQYKDEAYSCAFLYSLLSESFFDGQFNAEAESGYEVVVVSSYAQCRAVCKRNGVRFVPVNIPRNVSPMAIVKAVRETLFTDS